MMKLEGAFQARDKEGRVYLIEKWMKFADATTSAGRGMEPVQPSLRTSDGRHVNRLGKGRYEIPEDDIALTSDDPAAP
jgi:hypothetical protein